MDYETKTIVVRGVWVDGFTVQYDKRLAWRDPSYARRIYFEQQALDLVSGDMRVQYDCYLDLVIEAEPPKGTVDINSIALRVDAVAQHRDRSLPWA